MGLLRVLLLAMRVLAYWLWVLKTLFDGLAWVWEFVMLILFLGGKPA